MSDQGTKVTRNVEKYGLNSLDEELRDQRRPGASLRTLADFVNRRILEGVLADRDVEPLATSIRVTCHDCDESYSLQDFVERGHRATDALVSGGQDMTPKVLPGTFDSTGKHRHF